MNLIKHKLKIGKMYVSPTTVVHNKKNANLQTQPKRRYWQENTSISKYFRNQTTLNNQLFSL